MWDTDIPVDFSTLIEVEGLVDEYTQKVDDALDAMGDRRCHRLGPFSSRMRGLIRGYPVEPANKI